MASLVDAQLDRFEQLWATSAEPNLLAFAEEFPEDSEYHLQLATIDLERRLRIGCDLARCFSSQYCQVLPSLSRDQKLGLAIEEYRLRGATDPDLFAADLPQLAPELVRRLRELPTAINAAYAVQPERIGPYRLLRVLGEGGMGTVYLAQQDAPVRRRVALKVIRRGLSSQTVHARFEAECQALATMRHPHIVRFLDAGVTKEGLPFYVMEPLSGQPVTEFCARNNVSLTERLRLVQQLCAAIEHAHRHGIVHRDLKPSNILVEVSGREPIVKVIDFGLARNAQLNLSDKTICTRAGELLGSLDHMSPEQASMRGIGIDGRSDVYSIGVLLYELLSGQRPINASKALADDGTPMHEVLRMIAEDAPLLPGAVALENKTFGRARFSSDLDRITLKALEKRPERRYQSPAEVAQDLERFLTGYPVSARPATMSYRTRLFLKKNRSRLVTCGVVAGSLLLGYALHGLQQYAAEDTEGSRAQPAQVESPDAATMSNLISSV